MPTLLSAHARRATILLVLLASVAGCGTSPAVGTFTAAPPAKHPKAAASPAASPAPAPTSAPAPTERCTTVAAGFDCDFQRRIAAVQSYLANRPGTVGIVLRDRRTGAVWRNDHAGRLVWTASTIKLAMTVDLFLRDRAGKIHLTAADRDLIQRMLHVSDDNAADALWRRYGRAAYAARFPAYGLTEVTFVKGFQRYWGWMKCTPEDLDRLIQFVLDKLPADLRTYVVDQMRTVGENQQWGVWGAGAAARPGNKDGWSLEQGGWVINSVGFVGPGERYTLAMMNSLDGEGADKEGMATVTHVAGLLFAGRF